MLLDLAPLRRHRDFRLLFVGQFVSFFGSMITYVAVPYQLYQLTSSSLLVGLLGAVQLVPLLVFGLWGGAYADAMDRRRLLIGAEALLTLVSGALALNAAAPAPERGRDLRAGGGDVGGQRLPPADAGGDDAPPGRSRRAPGHRGADLAARQPGRDRRARHSAGFCIARLGMGATYLLDVGTFVVSLVALAAMAAMPPAEEAPKPGLRSIVEGLDYARRRPELLGTYIIDIVAMTFAMPTALFPAMAARLGRRDGGRAGSTRRCRSAAWSRRCSPAGPRRSRAGAPLSWSPPRCGAWRSWRSATRARCPWRCSAWPWPAPPTW